MRVTAITFEPNDSFLIARFTLEDPTGTLRVIASQRTGQIWRNRLANGDAHLAFNVRPDGGVVFDNELDRLAGTLAQQDFLGIRKADGLLMFTNGITVRPSIDLRPVDLQALGVQDLIQYGADINIPEI